jgi:hypothetical protein
MQRTATPISLIEMDGSGQLEFVINSAREQFYTDSSS